MAHVLMDQGRWREALEQCRLVLGHIDAQGLPSCLTLRDQCTVYTMEDVAKIAGAMGEPDKAIAWLSEGARASSVLDEFGAGTFHIIDKLESLLLQAGRLEEAAVWARLAPVEELKPAGGK